VAPARGAAGSSQQANLAGHPKEFDGVDRWDELVSRAILYSRAESMVAVSIGSHSGASVNEPRFEPFAGCGS
jgi:hypothetical protein